MIFQYLFPINVNRNRKKTAVCVTKGMFKKHMNRAPWAIEKLQETLCEKEEGKIKFMRKEETKKVFKKKSCTLSSIDLVYNLDSHSTKCRVIHDFTWMVKGSTLSLDIFSGEDGFYSLSKCVFLEWLNMSRKVSKYHPLQGIFLYVNLNT